MRKLFTLRYLLLVLILGTGNLKVWSQIAAWDFTGEGSTTNATSTADIYNSNLDASNLLTRGGGAAYSSAGNSFRTTGFKNDGISTSNTDFFQFTLSASPGNTLSLSTIDAKFAGTAAYFASPGVTSQFAYSLDGINFTLIGSAVQSTSLTLTQINLSGISSLQNLPASTTVTFRYYASGQTNTGGWGFSSSAAGNYGLAIGGSIAVDATPSTPTTTSISPTSSNAGAAGFLLTVNGTNFINGSFVTWNSNSPTTHFISSTQLTADIPASYITTQGTANIGVTTTTATPQTSNTQTFTINPAVVSTPTKLVITAVSPTSPVAGTSFSVTVQSQNNSGIATNVTSATDVLLSINTGTGTLGGTLVGTILNGTSSVTITGVTYSPEETGVKLTATPSSGMTSLTPGVSATFIVLAIPPTTLSSAILFGSQTTTTIPIISWAPGNGSGRIIVARLASTTAVAPTAGNSYSANSSSFTDALNSFTGTGNKVIYNGTESGALTVTSLSAGTTYSFDIYEYNGSGSTINYGAAFTGSRSTLQTEPVAHTSTFTASSISSFGLNLNFNATTSTSGYIILQTSGSATPTGIPVDGTNYTVGSSLGNGTVAAVVSTTSTSSVSITNLLSTTQYTFSIIPFGRNGTNTDSYNFYTGGTIPVTSATTAIDYFNLTTVGAAATEDFNGMGNIATAPLPKGFKIGTNWATGSVSTTLAAGTSGTGTVGTAGGIYNFANGVTATSTDRALGFITTGSFPSTGTSVSIILKLTNHTGSIIKSLDLSFDYEKYRSGSRQFDWTFFHGNTQTPSTSASEGDQSYPADGNNTTVSDPPSTINKTFSIKGISVANGADYYLKWTLTGLAGTTNGQGIAVDNLNITVPYSSDAALLNLALSSGTLSPSFDSATTNYTASVPNSVNSITITPTASNTNSIITVNGTPVTSGNASAAIALTVGDNIINTLVTAQNTVTNKTYVLTVNRMVAGSPALRLTSPLADFGNVCINNIAGPNSFTIDGSDLDGTNISIAALSGFTYSETINGTYSNALSFSAGNNFSGKTIFVKFNPTALQSYNNNIKLSGGGVNSYDILAAGAGVTTVITTGNPLSVGATTATVSGTINNTTCITGNYGFEYSTNSGFPDGSGTPVIASNLNAGSYSATITGLLPNTRYYYKAFVTNNGGVIYGSQIAFTNAPLPVVMASQPDLSFTENFSDIANWSNFFITGTGANHWSGLTSNSAAPGAGIPNGTTITASTNSFQGPIFGSSPGVQKGTDQVPSSQSIVLLSTGSPDNTTSAAIDFYMDFTGVNAGVLSFDYQTLNNASGNRNGSLRVYATTNGTSFTELPFADVLDFTNNVPVSGSKTNVALPVSFNNNPNARLRFYFHNGSGNTGSGSRPKISIDNVTVTAVATTPCSSPTAQPTSLIFGTVNDVSIQGNFTAASPAPDQYLVVMSTSSSLTTNPIDGQIYNIGDNVGDGSVIAKGNSTTFTASNLSASTTYYFFAFSVNGVCTGGPKYLITNPLTSNRTTTAGLPPCSSPAGQATQLTFSNVSTTTIQGSFSATTADEYLVLKSTSPSLTANPVNGHVYNIADALGNAEVLQRNNTTSFTASGLAPETTYFFFVFSINSQSCINGPVYNTTNPLTGSQQTNPLQPCVAPTSQPTLLTLTPSNTSISGTFNASNSADNYLIVRSTSTTLSSNPSDNTNYTVGSSLGGGIVIGNSSSTSFLATNLSPLTNYYFFVFAANKNCSGGTKYLTSEPLTGNAATNNALVYNYYFGNLHSHSDYSDGNKDHPGYTPADDYNYAISSECMDFLGISEHNHYSSADNPGNTIDNFHKGAIQAKNFNTGNPNFVALYGMEWGVISGGGHVVVYGDGMDKLFGWESGSGGWGASNNYDVYVPKSTYTGPAGLFKTINDFADQNTFGTLAHPNSTDFNNLANIPYKDTADNAITGVAVESGPAFSINTTYSDPSTMSYLGYYQTLLSKGYHLGPTIDHDNHNTTFGHTTHSRTAVLAPSLSQTEIIKAMHDMHFYATEDCDTKVDFRINTKIMGSVFSDRNAPSISVNLTDVTTNTSSAIIRVMYGIPGNGVLPVKIDSVIGNTLYFVDNSLPNNVTGYYYIDISNSASRIITSPIWYTRLCSVSGETIKYACGNYNWNGQTYTASGTYTKTGFTTSAGCDSTDILHLIITTPTTGDTTAVACNSFTWYGTLYTSSGTPTHELKERGGCDSTVTLHLTINYSSEPTSFYTQACNSLQLPWGGTPVTASGDYSHTYTNMSGCDSFVTAHVTIKASPAVSITADGPTTFCPGGSVQLTANSATSYVWSNSATTQSITVQQSGNYSVTITDANGCSATSETSTINVEDVTPPVVHTQDINVVLGTDGMVTITPSQINNGSTDNCSIGEDGYSLNKTTFNCTNVGENIVTLTVTDVNGNSSTGSATVTVTDNQDPTITAPSNISVNADNANCSATNVVLGSPVTADNCGVANISNNALSSYPVGTTTVTWTVTDTHGRTATADQTVTVTDNQDPTITAPSNVSVNADNAKCSAADVALGTPVTADNCDVAGVSNNAPSSYPVGTTIVTWIVTDTHGRTATADQTVTVTDNQDPTITAPSNVSVNADNAKCSAADVALGTPVTADNCDVAGVFNNAPSSYPVGTTTVTWTVTDTHGRTATADQTVTVTDNQDPTITAPANVSVNADNGTCTATNVALGTPVTADNCGVASVTNNHSSTTYLVGVTTVTWTVTDSHGRTATANQTVTVTDNQDPTITAPAIVSVNADNGSCSATNVVLGSPVTADNCGIASVTNDHSSTTYPVGTTIVTWTVTDTHGRTATANQTVTVTDNQDPTITAPSNVSVNADNGSCLATNVALGTPVTSDNCGVASVTNNHSSTTYPVGVTTVTWMVTDSQGRTATANQTVTVIDNQNPTITAPSNISVNAGDGSCSATNVLLGNPTTNDNCGVASVTNNHLSTTYPVGSSTVTWTVTDTHGHTSTATQNVTVTDNQNPTITCRANQARLVNNANCTYKVAGNEFNPTAFADNCPGATIKNNFNNSNTLATAIFPKGNTIVTWTVTDAHGRTTTCNTTITINSTLAISIPDVYAVQPGGTVNTIYIGYGPTSVTLNASVTGGTAPYNYKWTIGSSAGPALSTNASYQVTPTTTTTYVLNVKDVYGCSVAFATKTIKVVDVRCGTKLDKVTVCVYNKGSYSTNCVLSNSVSSYLGSGSYLGSCAIQLITSARISAPETAVKNYLTETGTFEVKVSPNPTSTNFKIRIQSNSNDPISIRLIDVSGRVISINQVQPNETTTLGNNLTGGTYFAEIIQGIHNKKIKLIKIN